MSLGLQATRRRISSVQTTRKITRAMEMIATTKLKSWRNVMLSTRDYTEALMELIRENVTGDFALDNPLFKENVKSDRVLKVVISSNLGLCGSYNVNLFDFANDHIDTDDELVVIGSRGYRYYKAREYQINDDFVSLNSSIDFLATKDLGEFLLKAFRSGKYRRVDVIFTHYINAMRSVPQIRTLLPLPQIEIAEKKDLVGPLIEPSAREVIDGLIPFYVNNIIFSLMIEAQISEQSARRFAMETATNNATDLIDELQVQYNKARQAAITQEITELEAGLQGQ